jgi:iron(III) transport system permease protein
MTPAADEAAARLAKVALTAALGIVVGWPFVVVVNQALVNAGAELALSGGIARPLGLARETLKLVGTTLALALPAGVGLAYLLERTDLPGRRLLRGLLLLGLFVPLPLHALAWLGAFGNLGRQQALGGAPILAGLFGAAFVHAMAALPWVVLIVGVGLRSVEPELEEAALMLRPAWWAALHVTLRRSLGAIAASAVAVAVLTAGEMTVTDLPTIGLRTYAEEAYTLAQQGFDLGGLAMRAALPQVILLGGLLALVAWWLGRLDSARIALTTVPRHPWPLGHWKGPVAVLVSLAIGAAVGLPLYGLIWRAGRVGTGLVAGQGARWSPVGLSGTLREAWADLTDPELPWYRTYLYGTISWAVLGTMGAVILAWPLAWAARRAGAWRVVAALVVALTLATPGPVAGLLLKQAYAPIGWLNRTPGLLVLGYIWRALPYATLVLWAETRRLPRDWLDAAAVEGLGPWRQAWRIGRPLTAGATLVAWLLGLALALGELPIAYVVRAPGYEPLPVLVWSLLHVGVESRLAGIGLIMLALTAAIGAAALGVGAILRLTRDRLVA